MFKTFVSLLSGHASYKPIGFQKVEATDVWTVGIWKW